MFIAIFVVAGTMALIIQQREHEIALLRAVAATPGQVRRMIAWEAAIVSLVASAAGVVPGAMLGRALARGFVRHSIAPPSFTVTAGWLPATAAVGERRRRGAVRGARRRSSRIPCRTDTRARGRRRRAARNRPRQADRRRNRDRGGRAAVLGREPDAQPADRGRHVGDDCPLPRRRRRFPRADRRAHRSGTARARRSRAISPVGGFLASANLRAATRRFSSASTPLVLSVALSCTLLFSSTTTRPRGQGPAAAPACSEDLAVTGFGAGLPRARSRRRACDAGRGVGGRAHVRRCSARAASASPTT